MRSLAFIMLFGILLVCGQSAVAQEFAVVAHPSVGISSLTKSEVAEVFLGKKTIVGGSALKLFILPPEDEVSRQFFDKVLETSASKFNQTWLRNAFSGGGSTPTRLSSSSEIVRTIAQTPGAIGYVVKSSASAASGCKVLYSE